VRYVENEQFLISESYLLFNALSELDKQDFTNHSLCALLEYPIQEIKIERFARATKTLVEGELLIQLAGSRVLFQEPNS